ncbi:MAG TPA: hypothetical protein VFS43_09055 [Polyangiaceae bacterium]|nr:hypothetical protein [Polyangiaceae bacterium]
MSTEQPCLSGTVLLDTRWAITQLYGEEVLARALTSVPYDVRAVYEAATHLSWVPCEQAHQVYDAVAREVGLSPRDMAERIVPLSVERSIKTVWRAFLGVSASDDALIARAPLLYARSRSVGTMTARVTGPGVAEMVIRNWPKMPEREISSLALGAASILRLAGRRAVRADTLSTPDGGRITVRWRG